MDDFFRCIHGRPIYSPSRRMQCRECYALALRELLKTYWRVRYCLDGMAW